MEYDDEDYEGKIVAIQNIEDVSNGKIIDPHSLDTDEDNMLIVVDENGSIRINKEINSFIEVFTELEFSKIDAEFYDFMLERLDEIDSWDY